jgi:hypothetical protein
VQQQLTESEHQVEEVLQSMPEGAEEQEWQRSLERVANRIARLGPINLAAIEEYDLQSERKTYLDTQTWRPPWIPCSRRFARSTRRPAVDSGRPSTRSTMASRICSPGCSAVAVPTWR